MASAAVDERKTSSDVLVTGQSQNLPQTKTVRKKSDGPDFFKRRYEAAAAELYSPDEEDKSPT